MGIFDFLRNLSKEKEETKTVSLDKVGNLIDSIKEKAVKNAEHKLREIKDKFKEEKNLMEDNIKILEEAELKSKAFPENVKPMMEDNRRSYIQRARALLKEINFPENAEKIFIFGKEVEILLDKFGKSTIRNYQIIQQYFGEKVSSISKNIINIHKSVKEAEKIAKDSRLEEITLLKEKFSSIQENIKLEKETEKKFDAEKEEKQKITEKIKETEKKIRENTEGQRHKRFIELIENKKDMEREVREVEKEPLHSFSVINDALKKYERISMDEKLVKKYAENPLKALEEDKELKITETISKMKESIDKLGLKEERKEKTLKECSKITKNYLETFLEKMKKMNSKLDEIKSKIDNETITKEIEELKEELRKEEVKKEENSHRIEKISKELKEINIEHLKKELESMFKDIGENIKIN